MWLAHDVKSRRYVALKVGVADSSTLTREVRVLQKLASTSSAETNFVPTILDDFEVYGPNGRHRVIAMTPARCSLRQAKGLSIFNLQVARALVGGLTLAVVQVHS